MSSPVATRVAIIARALIAAAAALTITFVQERTAEFSVAVFAAFAIASAVVFVVDAVRTSSGRVAPLTLAAVYLVAGVLMLALPLDAGARFHWTVVGWAVIAGAIELSVGIAKRRDGSAARDQITLGALTLLLAVLSLIVSPEYALDYFVDDAGQWFTLTGTIIGVGLFGGWAAIVAVYLGIGALSPEPKRAVLTKEPA